jgi:prepilin-type N-terminal cleavage/methylation domain-containing protein
MTQQHPDSGFTLIEVLLVIVILGLLASVVVASVGAITAEANETGCDADRRQLYTAVESFFAQRSVDQIPATEPMSDPDRYEKTLVAGEFMKGVSEMYDLTDAGVLTVPPGSPCTP